MTHDRLCSQGMSGRHAGCVGRVCVCVCVCARLAQARTRQVVCSGCGAGVVSAFTQCPHLTTPPPSLHVLLSYMCVCAQLKAALKQVDKLAKDADKDGEWIWRLRRKGMHCDHVLACILSVACVTMPISKHWYHWAAQQPMLS